ncbi:hypothetical protein ACFX4N_23845 [Priestia sp. YIM B13551]|uniref:hypothetical protein n=1 Tax=Priestia sp. YIM B13551 TaxID=3366306 RepID=UPI00366BFFE5
MTNPNELFAMYVTALNTQHQQALEQQAKLATQYQQALNKAFNQAMKEQQQSVIQNSVDSYNTIQQLMKQEQVSVSLDTTPVQPVMPIIPEPTPMVSAEPFIEDTIEAPKEQSFDMQVIIEKPCATCPFAATCEIKDTHKISEQCGVSTMKDTAMLSGDMEIHVLVDEVTKKETLNVYKNNQFVGTVAKVRENRPLIAELEMYENVVVHVTTQLHKTATRPSALGSIYTKLHAQVVNVSELPEVTEESKPVDPVQSIQSPENNDLLAGLEETILNTDEVTIDLGEMVLPI